MPSPPQPKVEVPEEAVETFVNYAEEHSGLVINRDLWIPALQAAAPAIRKQERQRVREALRPVEEKLERIRDLDEQTSDGALGSLARYALGDLAALDSLEGS
jgi:hypothetical protein